MSMKYWTTDGYGVSTKDLQKTGRTKFRSVRELVDILKNISLRGRENVTAIYEDIMEALNDNPEMDLEELSEMGWDDYGQTSTEDGVYFTIIAAYIEDKYNIRLDVVDDEDGESYLMYMPDYPWGQRCNITNEEFDKILKKACSLLFNGDLKPDYQSACNFG